MATQTDQGYRVNMRVDRRTGEHFAVVADAYRDRHGAPYYMGISESDGCWTELPPKYLTKSTRTTTTFPEWLKLSIDRNLGYTLNIAQRLYGR